MQPLHHHTCAVIVTYKYALERLEALIAALKGQVDHIYLVDNNEHSDAIGYDGLLGRFPFCSIIANQSNLGLAKALNQGIRKALAARYRYILLMDQDSRPGPEMVDRLIQAGFKLFNNTKTVAAVGPTIVEQNHCGRLPFLKFNATRIKKIIPDLKNNDPVAVDFLISSGCLIDSNVIRNQGLMDETLFIDNVDMEWCMRVRQAGYALYGIPNAELYHRLGDSSCLIPFINRPIFLHGPDRQYYSVRNRLRLYRRGYVPLSWKIQDLPRLIFKLIFFSFFVSPRRKNAKKMLKGIGDGFRNG
ncbi:MAG: glycosyltransferase family 2 protein [Deltaproteobacteria bacterium]|nr:glycosyltransferase family 2 protein [Deltaproteobacteria bacterium]